MSASRKQEGPRSGGAPSACGHDGCDPAECWAPTTPAPKAEKPKAKRKRKFVYWRCIQRKRCGYCQAWIWEGYDADAAAALARVDYNVFLTEAGEARAVERGRQTYDLVVAPYQRLEFRDDFSRAGRPAAGLFLGRPSLVTVEHVCGRPAPAWGRYTPPRKPSRSRRTTPPF